MEFTAKARFVRVSPQKARLVLGLIQGKRVETALNTLAFTNKGIAPAVLKVLRSAVENANYLSAEKGLDVDLDNLYVKTAVANEGPRLKRIRPAPMGRAYRYQRRMAHIEIELAEKKKAAIAAPAEGAAPAKPAARKPAAKKVAAKKTAGTKTAAKKTGAKKTAPKAKK
jgi:large subunit ribosomal protein L22